MDGIEIVRATPTAPTIAKLLGRLETLEPGTIIPYSMIEDASGVAHGTGRYQCIVQALKRTLWRGNGIIIEARAKDKCYEILPAKKRVKHASNCQASGIKKLARASDVAVSTDRKDLSDEEKATLDRCRIVYSSLRLAELTKPKEIDFDE